MKPIETIHCTYYDLAKKIRADRNLPLSTKEQREFHDSVLVYIFDDICNTLIDSNQPFVRNNSLLYKIVKENDDMEGEHTFDIYNVEDIANGDLPNFLKEKNL